MTDDKLATAQDFIFAVKAQQEEGTRDYFFPLWLIKETSFGVLLEDKQKTSTDFALLGSTCLFPGFHRVNAIRSFAYFFATSWKG